MLPKTAISRRWRIGLPAFFLLALAVFFWRQQLHGLDQLPPELQTALQFKLGIDPDPPPPPCPLSFKLVPLMYSSGLRLPATPVHIDASSTKFYYSHPTFGASTMGCDQALIPYAEEFSWRLIRPSGSAATLQDTATLSPYFVPDVAGTYTVELLTCPNDCEFLPADFNQRFLIRPTTTTLEIEIEAGAVPPSSEPVVPPQEGKPYTVFEDLGDKCPWVTSPVFNPQYVTVDRWNGAQDYRLLEGRVKGSKVSRKDYFANHFVHDFLIYVEPDPDYRDLAAQYTVNKGEVEVEWEFNQFPEPVRPTRGDRVSVLGYWIHDCGHNNKTEIHPPVMVASHRARPIRIPPDLGYGSNVWTAGIVSQVWVNRNAGEITGNCSATGLVNATDDDACLPQSEDYSSNPVDREVTFNIYLPENPRNIYAEYGVEVPTPPLYYRAFNSFVEPRYAVREQAGVTWLEVTLDLRNFSGSRDSMRIEAGWIYPSPDNWDLERWELTIPSMEVHEHSDLGYPVDVGDWKFWLNTNNTGQEWTKVLDCDECVKNGLRKFSICRILGILACEAVPWRTGDASENIEHWLGPHLKLFPWQAFWLQANGYDSDQAFSDDVGTADVLMHPQEGEFESRSRCNSTWDSGCGEYTLHYSLNYVGGMGDPNLTQLGQALYDTYFIDERRPPLQAPVDLPVVAWRDWNHPAQETPGRDSLPVDYYTEEYFPQQGPEPNTLAGMTNEEFQAHLAYLQENDPQELEAVLTQLKAEIKSMLKHRKTIGDQYVMLDRLQYAMPANVWDTYFSDLSYPSLPWIRGVPNWAVIALGVLLLFLLWILFRRK